MAFFLVPIRNNPEWPQPETLIRTTRQKPPRPHIRAAATPRSSQLGGFARESPSAARQWGSWLSTSASRGLESLRSLALRRWQLLARRKRRNTDPPGDECPAQTICVARSAL